MNVFFEKKTTLTGSKLFVDIISTFQYQLRKRTINFIACEVLMTILEGIPT